MAKKVDVKDIYSLSPMQEGMLFHYIMDTKSSAYFEQTIIGINGELNLTLVEDSFNKLVEKYDILRTVFTYRKRQKPRQIVLSRRKAKIDFSDISFMEEEKKNEYIEEFNKKDRERGFNLEKDIPMRISIIKTHKESYKLIWSFHHIIMDGWCFGIIVKDFLDIYMKLKNCESISFDPITQYSTYIKWLEGKDKSVGIEYWKEYLRDYDNQVGIISSGSGKEDRYIADEHRIQIKEDLTKKLKNIAKKNGVTINTIFEVVWGILLGRYNNTNDLVFGKVVSGRAADIPDIENIVGLFINTLPTRITYELEDSFIELIKKVQESNAKSRAYDYVPLAEIQSNSELKQGLIKHILVFENYPIAEELTKEDNSYELGFSITNFNTFEHSNYDFAILVTPGDKLEIEFKYNSMVYDKENINRIGIHLLKIIESIIKHEDIKIRDIEILTDKEEKEIINDFNHTYANYPNDKTIQQLFEEQVEKTPENIAVVFEEKRLTYREVNEKSNSLARILRDKGVKADRLVGIMVERSLEMIIGIMGILKSGGAYVPIDPEYPEDRIKFMLEDSNISILLTQGKLKDRLGFKGETIDLENEEIYKENKTKLDIINNSTDVAYVIYTSGSTGKPKGVLIEHKSIINTLSWRIKHYNFNKDDEVLQIPSFAFDSSVEDIFTPLISGAKLILIYQDKRLDLVYLKKVIEKNRISHFLIIPSLYKTFLSEISESLKDVKKVTVAGESCSISLVEQHFKILKNAQLYNEYGPTENSVCTTVYEFDKNSKTILIGKPNHNTKCYILDKNGKSQPIGVAGELCISGVGLARGYLNRPELTAEKFVENPFVKGERMYRTGDLARWLPGGNIEFLGRIDHQVKIRGYRIELGEIENVISKEKGIKEVVVLSRKDKTGMDYLCAYIVKQEDISFSTIKGHIRKELPDYMVPSTFIELDEIPLTPNGKINRKALLDIEAKVTREKEYEGARNEIEASLIKLWEDILGIEGIGVYDNFFDLGGHSLKATVLTGRIQRELSLEVTIRDIFECPNIRELSERMEASLGKEYEKIMPLEKQEYYPVSSAQRRMYAIQMMNKESTAYHMPLILELTGSVDRERIEQSVNILISKHEALRTSFHIHDEDIVQKIEDNVKLKLEYAHAKDNKEIDAILASWIKPFNLEKAPILRGGIVTCNNSYILMLDMHHIISDGVTMGILAEDFVKAYEGDKLKIDSIQYKEYAMWEKQQKQNGTWDKQKEYWKKEYEGEIPVLELALDGTRSSTVNSEGNRIYFEIGRETVNALKKRMSNLGGTLFMGLMAGYSILMSKYSGQEDIVIGTVVAGRNHPQMEKVAGMFVNTLAIRSYPESKKTIEDYLNNIKQKLLQAYENQAYPYDELVEELGVKRDLSRNPLFDVMIVLQNTEQEEIQLREIGIKSYDMEMNIAKFDITLTVTEAPNKLICEIEYKEKLFKQATIKRIIGHYIKVLKEIGESKTELIKDIDLLDEIEKRQLLFELNDTVVEYDKDKTIVELFEEQVDRTQENIAVVYKGKKLTYTEVNERSNSLAKILKDKGVKSDTIVGIMIERSLEMIVGIMAILKAGGAYVPIDPDYPRDRIRYMLEDSSINILLTQDKLMDRIDFEGEILDLENEELYKRDTQNLNIVTKPTDLAYVIYTSGSTGKPKGVMLEHKGVLNIKESHKEIFEINYKDKVLQFSSASFDASVWEMAMALLNGAELHILDRGYINDNVKFANYIEEKEITIATLPPTYLVNLDLDRLKKLKYLVTAGSEISIDLYNKLKRNKIRYVNAYGPTEATICATVWKPDFQEINNIVPIGKPISNTKIYILDKNNKLQPFGVPGELCISGDGLARGYLNRSELTAESFIENPFIKGKRIYKTGDLARWLPNGNIEFLGRIDSQVKIRGYRIEIGEIENILLKHESIKETVVIVKESQDKDKYLCGYIVADKEVTISHLREYLENNLPQYMIPTYFISLKKMPLTPNGKIDRKALPELDGSINSGVKYEKARNEIEEILISVWEEVISIKKKIGINDNFLEIGGDSIKAIQISARLQKHNLKLEVQKLFEYPTIKQLSCYVKDIGKIGEQSEITGNVDLTPIQIWFLKKDITDRHHWNQSVMLYRKEGFKREITKEAFKEIIKHHDALRMIYEENEEGIKQVNKGIKDSLLDIEIHDIIEDDYEKAIEERSEKLQSSIDLSSGPLVKVGLFKTNIGDYLLIVIHHLVIDGVSWRIILEDFTSAYGQLENGQAVELPLKTTSFKEWAKKLKEYGRSKKLLKEKEYWGKIEGEDVLPLPKDSKATENKVKDAKRISVELSKDETQSLLQEVNRAYNTEINDILLSALGLTIKEWVGINNILVALEGHGREEIINDIDVTRTVGWFTSEYPVILNMDNVKDIANVVKDTKETLRQIPNKGIGYGILKYITSNEYKKEIQFNLTPEISFNYLGQFDGDFNSHLFEIGNVSGGNQVSINSERHYTLDVIGLIANETLSISMGYNRNEYEDQSITNLIEGYKQNLQRIIKHCINRKDTEMTLSDFTSLDLDEGTMETVFNEYNEEMVKDIYSLSPMQEGMLFHYIMDRESSAYFEQTIMDINGKLDLSLVESSFNKLIEKYDVLRTVFKYEGMKKPRQVLLKRRKAQIDFKDITSLEEEIKTKMLEELKEKDRKKGFDLEKDIPMRISIIRTHKEGYKLIWSFHHIMMDGWCLAIIIKDFLDFYMSLENGENIKISSMTPYSTYIKWLEKRDKNEGIEYWKNYLEDYDEQSSITTFQSEISGKYIHDEHNVEINRGLTEKLKSMAKKNTVTINTIFEAVWGILLSKYNNTKDVVFGSVVAGRSAEIPDIENMVGLFINTVPVRIKYGKEDSFKDLINKLQISDIKSREYDYIPLAEIQSNSELKQELINHILVFENYPIAEEVTREDNKNELGFSIDNIKVFEHTNYDFIILIMPGEKLNIQFQYNSMIYDKETVNRIGRHLLKVVAEVIENKDSKVKDIEILTAEEKKVMLHDFNNSKVDYPKNKTLQELFEEQVEKTPNKIAVSFEEKELTYRELNKRANQIGEMLRGKGVDNNSAVALMVDRSPEMIIGILGILKSGGACLPVNVGYPDKRIEYMLEDSKADIILITERHREKLLSLKNTENKLIIDIEDNICTSGNGENLEIINKINDLLYLVYTSGTTGNPKGVMVGQRVIKNLVYHCINKTDIDFKDRVLQFSNVSFDAIYEEMYSTILTGGELCVVGEEIKADILKLLEFMEEKKIKTADFPAALVKFIFSNEMYSSKFSKTLNHLIVTGEQVVIPKLLKEHMRENRLLIHNHYGPSETHVVTTYTEGHNEKIATLPLIGKPISNTRIYIVDENKNLVPIGIVGELCIAGDCLGIGYLNKKELTNEKFVENPFEPGKKMYKTGDLARWLPNGNIEFLGRIDHQVKIRGFRVELGEIEGELIKHGDIDEAVVIDKKDASNNRYLCAYIVSKKELKMSKIREYLTKELPEYMIPSYIMQIELIPKNFNGKIERKALPEPSGRIEEDMYEEPRNEIEEKLVALWEDILGIEGIGINDNFFDLGGHSLKATILSGRIQNELDIEVSIKDIFEYPSIKGIAGCIKQRTAKEYEKLIPLEKQESYPSSSVQRRIYAIQMMDKESTVYNIPLTLKLTGKVDRERIEKAIKKLISKHEILRTSFYLDGEEIVQKINEEVKMALEYTRAEEKEEIDKIIGGWIKPFNLEKAPLLRGGIIEAKNSYILMLDMHHIISDGTTMGILAEDFVKAYKGIELDRESIQYKEYAAWEKIQKEKGVWDKQKEYWKKEYEEEIPVLELPLDGRRSNIEDNQGSRINFEIKEEIIKGLKERISDIGGTLFMGLMAGYSILMSKYSGSEDIVIGMPIAGRRHPQMERVAGMFINTLAVRSYPEGEKTIADYLKETKQKLLQAYENQEYPYEELVEEVGVKRDLSRNPLFDVMLVLQNTEIKNMDTKDTNVQYYEIESNIAKFDITLTVMEAQDTLNCEIEYKSSLFNKATIENMIKHYSMILKEIARNKEGLIRDIELLEEAEKRRLLCEFNDTKVEYNKNKTIVELLEEQVEKTPDKIALVYGNEKITYSELNEKANRLAAVLRDEGIKPDTIVGIMVDRSIEMIVGIIGILKAGGAYLPIDPDYPKDRIEYMLKDSSTKVLLTENNLINKVDFNGRSIDIRNEEIQNIKTKKLQKIISSKNLAYVIYTSGSTGKPKGVMVEHRQINNLIQGIIDTIDISSYKSILNLTTISFDIFINEIILPLMNGLKIVIADKETSMDTEKLNEIVIREKIDILQSTPSRMKILMGSDSFKMSIETLKLLMITGEAFPENLLKELNKYNGIEIYNMYGPTETTVWVTIKKLTGKEQVNIGKPISNTRIYILNKNNKLQSIGLIGELCIAGDVVTRGYINKPELTAERFVENPFEKGERMYRTGDLARWLPNGDIEFLGRIDNQVKIRGYRIELGEIQNAIEDEEGVNGAVVISRKDKVGMDYLCAYIVKDENASVLKIKEGIRKELPDYMIPSIFIELDKIPTTTNGKIDRKALLEMEAIITREKEYRKAEGEIETRLVDIWENVLGLKGIGVYDNFFDLGGHSLKAVRLLANIHREFDRKINYMDFYKNPTIRHIAKLIEATEKNYKDKIFKQESKDYYEVSYVQKRMWLINQMNLKSIAYNMPGKFSIQDENPKEAIEAVFNALFKKHEGFRTFFIQKDGEVYQKVEQHHPFRLDIEDISMLSLKERKLKISEIEAEVFNHYFNLNEPGIFRLKCLKIDDKNYMILFCMHHIISDGWSIDIIKQEFYEYYNDYKLYKEINIEPLRIQYKDFAYWQNRAIKEDMNDAINYWRDMLVDYSGVLQFSNCNTKLSEKGNGEYSISFDAEITSQIRKLIKSNQSSIFSMFLSCLYILIKRLTGKEDILIGTAVSGREHYETENIIGCFVNTLLLRDKINNDERFDGYLRKISNKISKALTYQTYPMELVLEKLGIIYPDIQVFLNVLDFNENESIKNYSTSEETTNFEAKFDLEFYIIPLRDGIRLSCSYRKDKFSDQDIQLIVGRYIKIVTDAVANSEKRVFELGSNKRRKRRKSTIGGI